MNPFSSTFPLGKWIYISHYTVPVPIAPQFFFSKRLTDSRSKGRVHAHEEGRAQDPSICSCQRFLINFRFVDFFLTLSRAIFNGL